MTKTQEVVELILKERERQKITFRDFEKRVGVSKTTMHLWKKGSGLTVEHADRALKELGVSITIGKEPK